jgi:hypothetical protein
MRALGLIGLNIHEQANEELQKVLELNPNHQGARIHRDFSTQQSKK